MTKARWTSRALKDLRKLEKTSQVRIVKAMSRFLETEVDDVRQLSGIHPIEWRLRVGSWRIRFAKDSDDETLVVLRVLRRDKAY